MIEALEDDIAEEVLAPGARPAVIEAFAPGCGACYQAGQVLALLSEHHPGVDFYRLSVADPAARALAARLGITAAPTILLWRDGREQRRLSGACPADEIAALVQAARSTMAR